MLNTRHFGNLIAHLRSERKETQEKLAVGIDSSQSAVSRFEQGESITLEVVIQLATYFGIEVSELCKMAEQWEELSITLRMNKIKRGFELKEKRLDKKISLKALGKLTGIDPVMISMIEKGAGSGKAEEERIKIIETMLQSI